MPGQYLAQHLGHVWVIVDDEDVLVRVSPLANDPAECLQHDGRVKWFEQICRCAKPEPEGLLVHDGEQDDRDLGRGRIFFQIVEHLPAIHIWHENIEQDRVWLVLARELQPLVTITACRRH